MTSSPKGQATREEILQIAAELFAAHGYHGTSYRSLVERSGLSKGAFYFHFSSKQELALEAYRTKQTQLLLVAMEASRTGGSALDRLMAALEARARAYVADPSLRILPRLSTDFARDQALAPVVKELHGNAIRAFVQLLREARDAGEVRGDLDVDAVARTIFATIVGMDEVSERETGGEDLLERSRDFRRLLKRALSPSPGASPTSRNPET